MSSLLQSVSDEIVALHDFFTDWFSGRCAKDDALFKRRLIDRMDEDLVLIQPGGESIGKTVFCNAVWNGYGKSPEFRAIIRNVELRPAELPQHVLVTYEEWQRGAKNSKPEDNARVASVLFALDDDQPGRWIHIHETWLPDRRVTPEAMDF